MRFPSTEDLRKIEEAGSVWASICIQSLLSEKDLKFFATRYKPFFEYLKEIEGRFQATVTYFDPLEQHEHCRTLFAPAFGTHGALMISPSGSPMGKVPDFRFASFEAGVIRAIRKEWVEMENRT